MAIDRATFLEIVKDAYSAYYTILPVEEGEEELPLAFRAEYKVRDEQYFFVKSANIWSNEKYEYCFVFSAPTFDAALAEKCMDFSLQEIGNILLQIRLGIQCQAVFQNLGEIVVRDDDVGQFAAGQSGSVILRREMHELDLHAELILQITPYAQLIFSVNALSGAVFGIADRQNGPLLGKSRAEHGQEHPHRKEKRQEFFQGDPSFLILFFNKTIRNRFVACEHTGSQAMAHGAIEEAVQY